MNSLSKNKRKDDKSRQILYKEYPYVILCEGQDEKNFLIWYLEYLKKNEQTFQDKHNIIDFGGNEDLERTLKTISLTDFYDDMKSFLIIRDAERDVEVAIKFLKAQIKRNWNINLEADGAPKKNSDGVKVGFFLLPGMNESGNFRNGTLEDLCLELVQIPSRENISAKDIYSLTLEFLTEIKNRRNIDFSRIHKNRIHALLSGTDKFVGMKIGEAAKSGAFDLSSEYLSIFRKRILQMQNSDFN